MPLADPVAFLRLRPEHAEAVVGMFGTIAADPGARHFHPHPFDEASARRVCSGSGRDLYFGLWAKGAPAGYGMLRGWDEGFEVPSLGIWVSSPLRGTGAARAFMAYLHLAARLSDASRVRLKVHPDNASALALYRSMGYRFSDQLEPDGQMLGILELLPGRRTSTP
jgi:ribosomal protein S18 acetylase RimI-like enzyme